MKYSLPQHAFFGDEPVEIDLPDSWKVTVHRFKADELPPMSVEDIRKVLQNPVNYAPLREAAKGKKKICIVFDDITRPTPTKIMAHAVLEELHEAGIPKENIIFLCALGTHGAHSRIEFVKKLGEDIVAEYCVYNHNCYENCVKVGTTKRGFDVLINKELMTCDFRIGLGGLSPHVYNGFSGGGKLLFPGCAHIETIEANHHTAIDYFNDNQLNGASAMGDLTNEGMRKEIEEMTLMADPNFFKVDAIYNTKLEPVMCFCGNVVDEYYVGAKYAQELYSTKKPEKGYDLVIANANAKGSEAGIATMIGQLALKPEGGDLVIVNCCETGQIPHYLSGYWGKQTMGRLRGPAVDNRPWGKTILFSDCPCASDAANINAVKDFVCCTTWDAVMKELDRQKPDAEVGILWDATMLYYV